MTTDLSAPPVAESKTTAGRGTSPRPPFGVSTVSILAVLIALFSLVPLGYVVYMTAATGWDTAVELIFRPRVGELLLNTVLLMVITVPLSIILGVGGAWLVERTKLRGHKIWAVLLAAPLAIPAFVNSYAWVSAVPSLAGLGSGVLIATLSYFPLVYIPAAATLGRLDPAIEQSAAALGLGNWRVFFRVVLPQLRIAMTGGALLVALHLLAEYGAFAMIRFDTFTTAIMVQYQSTFNGTAGNMLASVLVFFCLILLVVEVRGRGTARYARIGSGAQARALRLPLHAYQVPAQLSLLALTGLAFGLPVFFVLRWIVAGGSAIWAADEFAPALLTTLGYGLAGAVVTTVVAFPMAFLAVRHPSWFSKSLELSNYVTSSLPGIVVGLAFVTVSIRLVPGVYQTAGVLVAAYVLLFLPRALVTLRAGLSQAPKELDEAAQSLGKPPLLAFIRVTLRLTAPAAAGGAALVFLAIANELTATLLLSPNGTRTLATEFWSKSSEIDYAGAAPYALLMILLSAPMTYLLFQQSKKVAGQ
ncbi:ABC transporter permease [Pseudarthrobacter cellobiosi]|uniref:ABC transporter permease n=1 Tax=Pseudarthrobacter cellobiosi TaxID=2953654 RepID=UPI00208E4472|nr:MULTISPECIES: iron ABC transporter permease [unclassified Pseudarthrobacter]MCO4254835.1 iron ABC transporter permease [Pseudarthrobacter sp. HLT1-5]MCO4274733.1 iron ABC transporter permease [Pseudarthrobacter sp. HLT3-5]